MNLTRWLALAVLVVGVTAAGGLWYVFLRGDGPAPAALSSGSPVTSTGAGGSTATLAPPSSPSSPLRGGIDGAWSVDAGQAGYVGYRVQEELAGIGGNTAVGRTSAVTGTVTVAGTTITSVEISADLTQLVSDDQRRDGQLRQRGIETDSFPTATFKLTTPIELGGVPSDGGRVSVDATGDLTLHGVTRSVTIHLDGRLSGGTVEIAGSMEIVFADYGITPPTSFIALSVADHGTMEVHLYFTKG